MSGGWGAEYDDDKTQVRLDAFAAYMVDLTEFWPRVVNLFVGWMGKQFKTEGEFWNGTKWAPLSPKYAAWKALHYPTAGILVAEGDLRTGSSRMKPHQTKITPRFLVLTLEWPKVPEASRPWKRNPNKMTHPTQRFDPAWHHLGEGHNPVRPLLQEHWLNPEQEMDIDEAVNEYVDMIATRVGLDHTPDNLRPTIGV